MRITLPSAFPSIATGIVLGIARAAGETAPLIFTASFSYFWPARSFGEFWSEGLLSPISSLSVLIYNFAGMPYDVQQELAWVASFVLVVMILILNLVARWLAKLTTGWWRFDLLRRLPSCPFNPTKNTLSWTNGKFLQRTRRNAREWNLHLNAKRYHQIWRLWSG